MKKIIIIMLILFLSAGFCLTAQENETESSSENIVEVKDNSVWFFTIVCACSVMGLSLAALGGGIGQGIAISKAVEGIARQPEASSKIQTILLIGLAFIESVVIYVLVIVLILLYADPFLKYIVK